MEDVALAFVADVEAAVAGVRDLAESAQGLADTAKEAADGVASITEPATAAADSTKALADSSTAAADAQERLGLAAKDAAAAVDESAAATEEGAAKTDVAGESAMGFGSKLKMAALGLGVAAIASIKMAGDFQEMTTQLVTGAGESDKNLGMIKSGILSLSVATNTSVKDLTSGLYMIESAGFHGAAGLTMLKAAAEGAKVGDANLADVANVLTSAINAYHLPASQAVSVTSELVATVASGKMHMQDLASSISNVLPVAASMHLSFAQVGGAMATMTMQGMSARRASMNLANMLRSMVSPTAAAAKEMQALGLNANTVSQNIGRVGLTGTLQELQDAILRNTKGGSVLIGDMKAMTPAAQALAQQIMAGTISTKALSTATDALNPQQAALVKAFATSASSATGLKQTYDGAMKAMVGGATGLNVALLLGGQNMKAFKDNVNAVATAARSGSRDVEGWPKVIGDFNFKLGQAGKAAEAVGYALGDALLPAATKVMSIIASLSIWLAQNQWAAITLAAVIGGTLSVVVGGKMVSSIQDAVEAFKSLNLVEYAQAAASKVAAAAQWLWNAAMDANPITIVIGAIVALIAIIVLVTMHCKAFRDFWIDSWHLIEHAAEGVFNWLKRNWPLILGILLGPIATAAALIYMHWRQIVSGAEWMWHAVVGFFQRLPGGILNAVGNLASLLWNAGYNIVVGLWNGFNSLLGTFLHYVSNIGHWVSSFFGAALGIGSPSRVFYQHGVNTMLGYINGIKAMQPLLRATMAGAGGQVATGGLGGGTGTSPNVHVTVPVTMQGMAQLYNTPAFMQYLQSVVQEAVLRYSLNNPSNGLALAGRL